MVLVFSRHLSAAAIEQNTTGQRHYLAQSCDRAHRYQVVLLPLNMHKSARVQEVTEKKLIR